MDVSQKRSLIITEVSIQSLKIHSPHYSPADIIEASKDHLAVSTTIKDTLNNNIEVVTVERQKASVFDGQNTGFSLFISSCFTFV